MLHKDMHKKNFEPLIKDEEKIDDKRKKDEVFPIDTPATDPVKNTARENPGLNQAETTKNTPPLN